MPSNFPPENQPKTISRSVGSEVNYVTWKSRLVRLFKVNLVAAHPKNEELLTPSLEALVDTGSELTWLPAEVLHKIGIAPRRQRTFSTATKQIVQQPIGYAILRAEGFETTDEVVFAEPADMILLGVRTLEGFGVMVDNIAHRFVATTTLAAPIEMPIERL